MTCGSGVSASVSRRRTQGPGQEHEVLDESADRHQEIHLRSQAPHHVLLAPTAPLLARWGKPNAEPKEEA